MPYSKGLFALTRRIRNSPLLNWAVAGISGAGCLHFAVSFYLWSRWLAKPWPGQDRSWFGWATEMAAATWPVVGLFGLSAVALTAALCGKRWSTLVLFIFLIASSGAFAYDITNDRYQVRVDIATTEYWDDGGKQYFYWTWWWWG